MFKMAISAQYGRALCCCIYLGKHFFEAIGFSWVGDMGDRLQL
jgi:hypothetical protein